MPMIMARAMGVEDNMGLRKQSRRPVFWQARRIGHPAWIESFSVSVSKLARRAIEGGGFPLLRSFSFHHAQVKQPPSVLPSLDSSEHLSAGL